MATKAMPDEGEMESLYGGVSEGDSETHKTVDQEAAEENADSDVIKTSVLKSGPDDTVKPGDERVVKVVEVYGDTCKVIYAPKEEESPAEEKTPDEEIDEMSSEHDAATGSAGY